MNIDEIKVGVARVTADGLVFKGNIYTNAQMIKHQWFEHAANYGEWECPVGYIESNLEYLVLFNQKEMEVATSVEIKGLLPDEATLQAYYEGINNLKTKFFSMREHNN
ncbi:hypothetical protein [Fontibacillus sp. BL9]|uniref:hypothetical protein n=1 Tax=Fontibacillus sp. BL9 TaxID=3389971 RepID=UPI00397D2DC3